MFFDKYLNFIPYCVVAVGIAIPCSVVYSRKRLIDVNENNINNRG